MGFLDDLRGKSSKGGVLEKELLSTTDDGDHERFSHYVDRTRSLNLLLLVKRFVHCVERNGFQTVIRKSFQFVQHVKKFLRA